MRTEDRRRKTEGGDQDNRVSGCRLSGNQGIRSKNGGRKAEKRGISNIEQGILNDEGRVETEDPRQKNREACTPLLRVRGVAPRDKLLGKLQGG